MDTVKPFVKWAGGKNRLLAQIEQYFPRELDRGTIVNYIEPFLGGGALFFLLSRKYEIEKSYLFDMNKDLILTYHVIQKGAEDLLVFLEQYQKEYDNLEIEGRKKLFLDTRERFNSKRFEVDYGRFSKNWILRAAQFIFLNKTCFNGLFRLNAKGEFNVPFGSYRKASILNEENIIAVSRCLKNSRIIHANYTDCWDFITKDSFVYFDPPYRPINQTSKFTAYTDLKFQDKEQLELAGFFKKIDREKAPKLMLSNSDPKNENPEDTFFEEAYSGYNIVKVCAGRSINCNGSKRGKINELLITNY